MLPVCQHPIFADMADSSNIQHCYLIQYMWLHGYHFPYLQIREEVEMWWRCLHSAQSLGSSVRTLVSVTGHWGSHKVNSRQVWRSSKRWWEMRYTSPLSELRFFIHTHASIQSYTGWQGKVETEPLKKTQERKRMKLGRKKTERGEDKNNL